MCKKCDTDDSATTTAPQSETDFTFYLGQVRDAAHDEELQEIARWLDHNKFSCTYSIVDGRALFDVCPHPEDGNVWKKYPPHSRDGFVMYAAEYLIHGLSRALGERDAS
jgi:hypothetical protein